MGKYLTLAMACFVSLLPGCGQREVEKSGRVTLDGKPLGQVIASYWCGDKAAGAGTTDDDGTFKISGLAEQWPTGRYTVTVCDKKYLDASATVGIDKKLEDVPPSRVPAVYFTKSGTPLLFELKSGNNQLPPIELKSP